jgi:hypothetical protein
MSLVQLKKIIASQSVTCFNQDMTQETEFKNKKINNIKELLALAASFSTSKDFHVKCRGYVHIGRLANIYIGVSKLSSVDAALSFLMKQHEEFARSKPGPTTMYQYSLVLAGYLERAFTQMGEDGILSATQQEDLKQSLTKIREETKHSYEYIPVARTSSGTLVPISPFWSPLYYDAVASSSDDTKGAERSFTM